MTTAAPATPSPSAADDDAGVERRAPSAPRRLARIALRLLGEAVYFAALIVVGTDGGAWLLARFFQASTTPLLLRDLAILSALLAAHLRLRALRHPLRPFTAQAVFLAVAALWIGLAFGSAALPALFGVPFNPRTLLDFVVIVVLFALLSDVLDLVDTLIHEGGHVVVALLERMPIRILRLGPFVFERRRHGIGFAWSDEGVTGGATAAIYRPGRWPRLREFALSIAGGLVSVVAGILIWRFVTLSDIAAVEGGVGALRLAAFDHSFSVAALSFLSVRLFVAIAVADGLTNLLPRYRGLDGYSMQLALKGGQPFHQLEALYKLDELLIAGVRWRDLPEALINTLLAADGDGELESEAYMIGYRYALDLGEIARAGQLLDFAIATAYGVRPSVALEIAYYVARHRGDAALASLWRERVPVEGAPSLRWARAAAAVALADGQPEDARMLAEAGLAAAERLAAEDDPNQINVLMETDQLRELLALAEEAQALTALVTPQGDTVDGDEA